MDHIIAALTKTNEDVQNSQLPVSTVKLQDTWKVPKRSEQQNGAINRPLAYKVQAPRGELTRKELEQLYKHSLTVLVHGCTDMTGRQDHSYGTGVIEQYPVTATRSNKLDPFSGQSRPGHIAHRNRM
jgi:hypothetical protein